MKKSLRWIIAILCLSVTATVCVSCGGTQAEKTELEAPIIASAVYTGETITATVPENEGYKVVTNDGGIHVGEYDVVLELSDASKYVWKNPDETDATKITLKFAITQADNEITKLTVANVVFGEATVSPAATAKFGTPTFTYSNSANGTFTETVPSAVGKYFVKATVAETADYKGATRTASFEITKTVPEFSTEPKAVEGTLVYNGSPQTLIAAGATDHGTIEYKLGKDGEWSETLPSGTDAGEYKVYYRIKGDESHADYEAETPIVVSIDQATPELTAPTAKTGLVFTGSDLELVVAGSTTGGELEYKLDDGQWGTTVPVATDAKAVYTVYYRVAGNENYKDIAEASLTVSIGKANSAFTKDPKAVEGLKYDKSEKTLITAGETDHGTIEYKLGENGPYGADLPKATNAGEYKVYYRIIGDKNHNNYECETPLTVKIEKADNAITVGNIDIKYGDDPVQNATATSGAVTYTYYKAKEESGKFVKDGNAITWSKTDCKPGLYCCVIAAGNKNYENKEQDVFFHVTQATSKIAKFELTANTFKCGEQVGYNEEHTGGNAVIRFSRAKDGEYVDAITFNANVNDGVGNGFDYYAKLFIDETDCYTHAQTEGIKFNLYHSFGADGVCTACHNAQTGIIYAEDGDVAYVSGYDGNPSTEVYVRSTYNNKPVTYVKAKAFEGKNEITKIVFPESVTDLQDLAFNHCTALEYVDIRSVKKLSGGNVFLNCDNLRTVIIGSGYQATDQQFNTQSTEFTAKIELCVYGTETATLWPTDRLVKNVFYLQTGSETIKCLRWRFNESGEVIKGASEHNYGSDGKCTVCGRYGESLTKGVTYAYADGNYYVAGYTGSDTTVNVLGKYNDGFNGEYDVTYIVAECAWGTNVTKIILPDSITGFGGNSFQSATNLEYISMTGVKSLSTGNNFINCGKITTVIVNKDFQLTTQQFKNTGDGAPTIVVYVDGAYTDSTFTYVNRPSDGLGNEFLTGVVYYKGDGVNCFTWTTNDDGTIKAGPVAHSYGEDGKCTVCGKCDDKGITYVYDNGKYYVSGYTGSDTTVNVLGKYNDGFNGEYDVTYIAGQCAWGTTVTKIILPESITGFGGNSFQSATNLEYISMTGVKELTTTNNFINCGKITTVIVNKDFQLTTQQFKKHDSVESAKIDIYVNGKKGDSTFTYVNIPNEGKGNEFLTGKIYYYSESAPTDTENTYWHYGEDGFATLWS